MSSQAHARESVKAPVYPGLEGIIVAETSLSEVDGERGQLIIRGLHVEELVERVNFEGAVALLWGRGHDEASVRERLGKARVRAFERLPRLGDALTQRDGMDALRAAVAQLADDATPEELVGAVGLFAVAWAARLRGETLLPPDAHSAHAADLIRLLSGHADAARARALDTYLTTVIDHGLNASTFAARVVASTRSDLVSSVVAGIGALKGPLHGGAPGPVLDMLDAVGEADSAREFLERALARGERIMGMGHRIYRVRDPRALVLERALERLRHALDASGDEREALVRARLSLAQRVEREAERLLSARYPERSLRANVEFYTAVLLEAAGIPRQLFTLLFAAGRVAGWIAHVEEQRETGRLIRPASRYVGPRPA